MSTGRTASLDRTASDDQRVGFSHTPNRSRTHTNADVDAERDYLFKDRETERVAEVYVENGFHKVLSGRNARRPMAYGWENVLAALIDMK